MITQANSSPYTLCAKELGKEINREKVLVEIIELLDKVIQKQVNQ